MMGNNRPAGTSTVYHLLRGAFSPGTGPSNFHRLDLERLTSYLLAAVKAQLTRRILLILSSDMVDGSSG